MRKSILLTLLFVVFIISCKSQNEADSIIKELQSEVKLPSSLKPIETLSEWFPNGDGYDLIRYEITDQPLFARINHQFKSDPRYMALPFGNEIIDDFIFEYVNQADHGLYRLEYNKNDQRDIKMVVLNTTKKELIFFISFQ